MTPPTPAKLTRADLTRHPHLAALLNKPAAAPIPTPPPVPTSPPPLAPVLPSPRVPAWERAEILAHGMMLGMVAAGLMRILLGVWT